MTREELKEHCKRQVQQFERVEKIMPVTLNDWKRYEEHKLILELLEQEPRWIPTSERLPEEDADVLVTLKCGLIGIMQKKLADDDNGEPCYIWQDFEGEEHEVVAWMPLPKPYEPQESDIDKRKPCINYSDGCEEWAGCPCVYYKAESEE